MALATVKTVRPASPLAWPSQPRLRQIERWLGEASDAWATGWGLTGITVECHLAWRLPSGLAQPSRWQPLVPSVGQQEQVWLACDEGWGAKALATALFNVRSVASAEQISTTCLAIGQDARAALLQALEPMLCGSAVATRTTPDTGSLEAEPDDRPWSGGVRVLFSLPGQERPMMQLHLFEPALRSLLAPASRVGTGDRGHEGTRLEALAAALSRHQVPVQARLGDLMITLGDLQALQIGDVLVTAHQLDTPLTVWSVAKGAVSARRNFAEKVNDATLVQRDGWMAVALAPPSIARSTHDTTFDETTFMSSSNGHNGNAPQLIDLPHAVETSAAAPRLAPSLSPLMGVKTRLQVCVGHAELSVGDLCEARVGHVITLDREVDGAIDLLLDGHVVARGQLVAVGDVFGIRLTELPAPLAAPSSLGN